jgi:hypothetical protein
VDVSELGVRQGTAGKLGWESGTYSETLKVERRLFFQFLSTKTGIPAC